MIFSLAPSVSMYPWLGRYPCITYTYKGDVYVQYIQGTVSTLGHYSLQPTMYNIYTVKVPNLIIPMPKNPPPPPPGIEINPRKKRKKKTKQNKIFFFFGIKNYNNKIPSSYQRPRGKVFKTWFQFLGKFFFFLFLSLALFWLFFLSFLFFPFLFGGDGFHSYTQDLVFPNARFLALEGRIDMKEWKRDLCPTKRVRSVRGGENV